MKREWQSHSRLFALHRAYEIRTMYIHCDTVTEDRHYGLMSCSAKRTPWATTLPRAGRARGLARARSERTGTRCPCHVYGLDTMPRGSARPGPLDSSPLSFIQSPFHATRASTRSRAGQPARDLTFIPSSCTLSVWLTSFTERDESNG
jgi:hypothetical protein